MPYVHRNHKAYSGHGALRPQKPQSFFNDMVLYVHKGHKAYSGHGVLRPQKPQGLLGTWCLTSTKTVRLIRDGRMEVGEEEDYIPIATLSPTPLTSALRLTAMRAILMFQ